MSILNKMKLRTKLIASFLSVALMGAAISLYAVYENKISNERSTLLYEDMTLPLWHIGEIAGNFHAVRAHLEQIVSPSTSLSKMGAIEDKIAALRGKIGEHQKALENAAKTDEEKRIMAEYQAARALVGPVLVKVVSLAKEGRQAEAEALMRGELDAGLQSYNVTLDNLKKMWVDEAKATAERNDAVAHRTEIIVISLTLLGLALSVFIGLSVTRSILADVGGEPRSIREFAERIAGGDISIKSHDEDKVTGISKAVGHMNTALQSLIIPMTTGMTGLAASSSQVTSVAAEVRRSASDSAQKLSGVAAAAEQMQSNMSSVAAAVEETSSSVASVATAAEELSVTITEISHRASEARHISDGAVTTAKETGSLIADLSEAAAQIGKVTETISEISEQTKLLALNATIEAARAGEAGKGFAVVASEIKELARQVALATSDISNRVDGIRHSTDKTRDGINSMASVISNVNEAILTIASAVEEQSVTVMEIARNAQEVAVTANNSSSLVMQSSVAAGSVAKDVAELDAESAALAGSMGQLDRSAEELTRMAAEMKTLVDKFKV